MIYGVFWSSAEAVNARRLWEAPEPSHPAQAPPQPGANASYAVVWDLTRGLLPISVFFFGGADPAVTFCRRSRRHRVH
eukprot:8126649-Pyramimonas_sp.AAC.1